MALADTHTGGSRAMMVRWTTDINGATSRVGGPTLAAALSPVDGKGGDGR
jgi:hypothetical protein